MMNPAGDPWRISAEEHAKYSQQFASLNPQNGFLSGQQASEFFRRSALPQNLLAQVWNMADLNGDGRLDRREFCIAVHLIYKAKMGLQIPAVLPETMKMEPGEQAQNFGPGVAIPGFGMAPMAGYPTPMVPPIQAYGMQAPVQGFGSAPPMAPMGNIQVRPIVTTAPQYNANKKFDWSISAQMRLKYSQEFNSIDRAKSGFISGVQARNILTQSGLPNQILAQIWNLSDMDKDGRLSNEEYSVAMFLIDKMKSGEVTSLPPVLPPIYSLGATRQRSTSVISADGRITPADGDDAESSLDRSFPTTFEDKRKENFDRGQAELERRRQLLQEQERRERDERERKERQEAEKRERERQEVERRQKIELEKEMELRRQEEARREEEYRKQAEQRELARREMEKQRQIEMEKHRLHELMLQRQREQETNCHVKQKQKTAQFQLLALNERSHELDSTVVDIRNKIMLITGTIEGMKQERDSKLADMDMAKRQIQELNISTAQTQLELRSLKSERNRINGSTSLEQNMRKLDDTRDQKAVNVEKLRSVLQCVKQEIENKLASAVDKNALLTKRNVAEQAARDESDLNRDLVAKIVQRQNKLTPLLLEKSQRHQSIDAFGAAANNNTSSHFDASGFSDEAWPTNNGTGANGVSDSNGQQQPHQVTRKFRAIYEFAARGNDELSFQPGDTILVFGDHKGEPGWLAGQIKDKVGWFPEAFAESIDSPSSAMPAFESSSGLVSPQQASKLEPINEEGAPAPMTSSISNGLTQKPAHATAQFHWKGKKEDHLSFSKGDTVLVLEMQEMWWFGETNDGKRGWFPKSYVRLNTDSTGGVDRRKSELPGSLTSSASNDEIGRDVKSLTRKFESLEFPPQSPRQPERRQSSSSQAAVLPPGIESGEWYRSLYPFPEMEPGDLQFETGDDIFVVEKTSDAEWWTGICNGRRGVFPANYVQKLPAEEAQRKMSSASQKNKPTDKMPSIEVMSPTSPGQHEACEVVKAIAPFKASGVNQLSLETGDWIKVRSKSPTGWWEGELQQKKGAVAGEKKIGWFPGNYVVQLERNDALRSSSQHSSVESANSVIHVPSAAASREVNVVAMFDYAAQQEDELTLTRGEILRVVDRPDDDWWTGETLDGARRGVFPATYVQLCNSGDSGAAAADIPTVQSGAATTLESPSQDIR